MAQGRRCSAGPHAPLCLPKPPVTLQLDPTTAVLQYEVLEKAGEGREQGKEGRWLVKGA